MDATWQGRRSDNLDIDDPEVRKNILVAILFVILVVVIVTVVITAVSWQWGVAAIASPLPFSLS
jgi:hypothetical protein